MSVRLGGAAELGRDAQPLAAPAVARRWPDSTPPPLIFRRPLTTICAEIRLKKQPLASRIAKRAIDVVGSAVGLAVLSPVFAITAVAVRLSSKGPAFFVQERCGLGGQKFRFYKFRTMVEDAEARRADIEHLNEMSGPVFKISRDPRVTRLGAFLRKRSIDELPQLWNVLKGDMSLVGPRPPLPEEVESYSASQAQRLSVIPGITGLWQVSGRNELSDFDQWLALDLKYADTWSVWLDLKILARTVLVVALARGAH